MRECRILSYGVVSTTIRDATVGSSTENPLGRPIVSQSAIRLEARCRRDAGAPSGRRRRHASVPGAPSYDAGETPAFPGALRPPGARRSLSARAAVSARCRRDAGAPSGRNPRTLTPRTRRRPRSRGGPRAASMPHSGYGAGIAGPPRKRKFRVNKASVMFTVESLFASAASNARSSSSGSRPHSEAGAGRGAPAARTTVGTGRPSVAVSREMRSLRRGRLHCGRPSWERRRPACIFAGRVHVAHYAADSGTVNVFMLPGWP